MTIGSRIRDLRKQVRLIRKAIQFRIEEEAERLAVGMEVPRDEIMRVWEEHKDD